MDYFPNLNYSDDESEAASDDSNKSGDESEFQLVELIAPPPESTENDLLLDTVKTFLDFSVLSRQALVYGERIPKAVRKTSDIPGYESSYMYQLIEKKLTVPFPIQSYVWPCIFRGRSVTCISSTKTGKTTSYLIPTLSRVQSARKYEGDDESCLGPRVIVVCSSRKKAVLVRDLTTQLINQSPKICFVDRDNEDSAQNQLLNGVELLILTPEPLKRLISKKVVTFEGCELLVFDDADRSFILHQETIQLIVLTYYRAYKETLPEKTEKTSALYAPMLILGETWTDEIKEFQSLMEGPILVFGDFYEAALSIGMKISVSCHSDREQALNQTVFELIRHNRGSLDRIAIVCNDSKEAIQVVENLVDLEVQPVRIDENVEGFEIENLISKCRDHPRCVTVITYQVIKLIYQIDFIDTIIHYNPPDLSSEAFRASYMMMRKNLENRRTSIESHFILTVKNSLQAHQLSNSLARIHSTIPDKLECLKKLQNRKICPIYLSFAFCPFDKSFCNLRHRFGRSDLPYPRIPINGQIRFEITHVICANNFYLRILEFRDFSNIDGSWTKFRDQMSEIKEELKKLKGKSPGKVLEPKVGGIYGISVRESVYRVKVESVEISPNGEKIAALYYLDIGCRITASIFNLIELPQFVEKYPSLAYQAYLPGIKPADNEVDWSHKATAALYNFVGKQRGLTCVAFIRLQRFKTFWLDRIKILQNMVYNGKTVVAWTPKFNLIDSGLAASNDSKFNVWDDRVDEMSIKWNQISVNKLARFATLEKDFLDYYYLSNFKSTDEFYLHKVKNLDLVKRLEKDAATDLELKTLVKIKYFVDGLIALGYNKDEGFLSRIKILNSNLVDSESTSDNLRVVFLDYGIVGHIPKNECYIIPEGYVKRLPFQAIKCGLADFKGSVNPDTVYKFTRKPDEKVPNKKLMVKFITAQSEKALVQLFIAIDDENVWHNLGKLLLDKGCQLVQVPVENGLSDSVEMQHSENEENPILEDEVPEFSEEWEREEYYCRKNFEDALNSHFKELAKHLDYDPIQFKPKKNNQKKGRAGKLISVIKRLPKNWQDLDSDDEVSVPTPVSLPERNYKPEDILNYDPEDDEDIDSGSDLEEFDLDL